MPAAHTGCLPVPGRVVTLAVWRCLQNLRRVSQDYAIDLYLRPPVTHFRLMDYHLMVGGWVSGWVDGQVPGGTGPLIANLSLQPARVCVVSGEGKELSQLAETVARYCDTPRLRRPHTDLYSPIHPIKLRRTASCALCFLLSFPTSLPPLQERIVRDATRYAWAAVSEWQSRVGVFLAGPAAAGGVVLPGGAAAGLARAPLLRRR